MFTIHPIAHTARERKRSGRMLRPWSAYTAPAVGDVCPDAVISQAGVGFKRGDPAP